MKGFSIVLIESALRLTKGIVYKIKVGGVELTGKIVGIDIRSFDDFIITFDLSEKYFACKKTFSLSEISEINPLCDYEVCSFPSCNHTCGYKE